MNTSLRFFFFALQIALSSMPAECCDSAVSLHTAFPGFCAGSAQSSHLSFGSPSSDYHLVQVLRSGNVESNPCTDIQAFLKQLLDEQAQIAADVTLIKNNQTTVQTKIEGIESRCVDIESELSQLSGLDKRVQSLEDKIARLDHTLAELTDKNDDLKNRSRRNNLIIYGLQEPENESSASLLNLSLISCLPTFVFLVMASNVAIALVHAQMVRSDL